MPNGSKRSCGRGTGCGGRIYLHERPTNDSVPTIGTDIPLPPDLAAKYNETIKHDMKDTCKRDYRNRMERIMKYWEENAPAFFDVGVVDVSEQDQHDPTKYFFKGKFKRDLNYEGMNTEWMKVFLVNNKTKKDGKYKS